MLQARLYVDFTNCAFGLAAGKRNNEKLPASGMLLIRCSTTYI
jgi:hypothetical protein